MKGKFLIFILLFVTSFSASSQTTFKELSCEHFINPIGIDIQKPRLSWKMVNPQKNMMQVAYQLQVATSPDFNAKSIVWDSKKIESNESILQEYNGPSLKMGVRYHWRVKIWDNKNIESQWSPTAFWEMGIPSWEAKWIEPEKDIDTLTSQPSPLLRKEFAVNKKVKSARLYVTSRGVNAMYLNGQRVGNDYFTPGWTTYNDHIQYFTYDVTSMLKTGKNALGSMLGDGWYRGFLAWEKNRNVYGKRLALLAQLNITFEDGSTQVVNTDNTWKANTNGPIRMSDIYHGETYDARMELPGWNQVNFDDKSWWNVSEANYPKNNIICSQGPPVRKVIEIKAVKIIKTPQGDDVIDFGQEITGWVKFKVKGKAGDKITIHHAEVLDKFGNFYTENLRFAKCELNYILKGGSEEVYEPNFTFQGFRFIRVKGMTAPLVKEDFTAIVLHSDMTKTGEFKCSEPLLNQLQSNIQWGQRGNFLDVPTDCPQRDERLGWTGDAQAFSRTSAFNFNVAGFFSKWLHDLIAEQAESGSIPFVIPDVLQNKDKKHKTPSAGWADAATIVPWNMYLIYGDKRLLERQYPSMEKWVAYMTSKAENNLYSGSVFGDWLFYQPPVNRHTEKNGYTDYDYISTAFYALSVDIMRQSAEALGKKNDVVKYAQLFENIKQAFNKEFVTPGGRTASDSQTSYVLGLMFNLFKEENREKATSLLVRDIVSRKNHLSTGFLGTPYLCHVLSDNNKLNVAYDLLLQKTYPSWLYPVTMGATTIWERWDGIRPDTTFQDAHMNSFNHYAYGAIGDWMYRVVAGIELGKPGYKNIIIQPQPTDSLTYAKANFESSYGEIASGWERDGNKIKLSIKIPMNTTASVRFPTQKIETIKENGRAVSGIKKTTHGYTLDVGSGEYTYEFER